MKHKKAHIYKILYVLMGLSAAGILFSAYIYYSDNQEYIIGDNVYQQIRSALETSALSENSLDYSYENKNNGEAIETNSEGVSKKPAQINAIKYNFTLLLAINTDITGWITLEDSEIDYPLVQAQDNNYYLRRLFNGAHNKLGSIFMDYRNNKNFSDKNTVIYGHNMRDGSMFSSLIKYENQKYFENHSVMLLYTPYGDFTIELFAGMIIDASYDRLKFDFANNDEFLSYIKSLKNDSFFISDTIVNTDDRIITLCTCSDFNNNARYAIYGKLVPVYIN